jgi:endoglucanase
MSSHVAALYMCAIAACAGAPNESRPREVSRSDPIEFWSEPRAGANFFNRVETRERFEAAHEYGIDFVRLTPSKWQGEGRDFLIGDADEYRGLMERDLHMLRAALRDARAASIPVVLTMLTLPGARWRQHNGDQNDTRLYSDESYIAQAAACWRDLAIALRGERAIVGYNLLNEPVTEDSEALARVHRALVDAVRSVDTHTPIMLDGAIQASPSSYASALPIDDDRVLYAAHLYEPWEYTTWRRNEGRTPYPSPDWNRDTLARALAPLAAWQARHRIRSERIVLAEIGCDRRIPGVERHLRDAIEIAQSHRWHWAFYSFREDTWHGMDYELGARALEPEEAAYYEGESDLAPRRGVNPIFDVLLDAMR